MSRATPTTLQGDHVSVTADPLRDGFLRKMTSPKACVVYVTVMTQLVTAETLLSWNHVLLATLVVLSVFVV